MSLWHERLRYAVAQSREKHSLIARDAGVTPETLSRILNKHDQRPGLETVAKIAHAVGVSVGWLLGEDDYRLTAAEREQLREAAEHPKTTPLMPLCPALSGHVRQLLQNHGQTLAVPPRAKFA